MDTTQGKSEYDLQAERFVADTGLRITKKYDGHRAYFEGDKEQRAVWLITFQREGRRGYTFTFGDSVNNSYAAFRQCAGMAVGQGRSLDTLPLGRCRSNGFKDGTREYYNVVRPGDTWTVKPTNKNEPSDYSILSCLEVATPISFADFCAEYGYDTDSRKAEITHRACLEQRAALEALFTASELEALAEIR